MRPASALLLASILSLLPLLPALASASRAAVACERVNVLDANGGLNERYVVVARGLDNGIYYTICNASSGTCEPWKRLPGSTPDAPSAAWGFDPAQGAYSSSRVYIVVRGMDNGIYFGYIDLNTRIFSGWKKLPGSTPSRPVLAFDYWGFYMIAIVVRGMDNKIYYNIYFTRNYTWSGWKRIPLGSTIDSPAAAITDAGLHIVVRGSDGRSIWYACLDRYSFQFSGWRQLPGSTPSAPSMTSDGYYLAIAVRGADNRVYISWDYGGSYSEQFKGWVRVPTGSTVVAPAIEISRKEWGAFQIAVIGSDGKSIWYTQVYSNGTQIMPWSRLPGSSLSPVALTRT